MAGGSKAAKSSNPTRIRKRVEVVDDSAATAASLKRARDGSAFAKCGECGKDVAVALIGMHDCSLDAKIKMNLEAQVVEHPTENKPKRKAKSDEPKPTKGKRSKNPNARKRPPTAFFIFMDDFRKTYKQENPDNKSVSVVGKAGGEQWKLMTEEEKQVYKDKAAELKAEYEKALESDEKDGAVEIEDDEDVQGDEDVKADEKEDADEDVKADEKEDADEDVKADEKEDAGEDVKADEEEDADEVEKKLKAELEDDMD